MIVGFSTGSLALGNFRLGLQMTAGEPTAAVELSALREEELIPLVQALPTLDLDRFSYVSLHAPSRLVDLTEDIVTEELRAVADRGWPIIVHPDVITNFELWRRLGDSVCLENMDKRKRIGRTARELEILFNELPAATLCFDIGHARQVDPTMYEAEMILRRFRARIRQIHLSLVNSSSAHEPLNLESRLAYSRVAHLVPKDVPIILETPVSPDRLHTEIVKVHEILQRA